MLIADCFVVCQEEGEKVITQLLRLAANRHPSLFNSHQQIIKGMCILIEVIDSEYVSQGVSRSCVVGVHQLYHALNCESVDSFLSSMSQNLAPDVCKKLEHVLSLLEVLGAPLHTPSSPLATAPIHDVLLRRQYTV
jgi:hypothetical protein